MATGKVQGVGYRYFVQQNAQKLTLTGWVRNCSNGSVEGEVQGNETVLNYFFERIKTEHPWARIDQLNKETVREINNENDFTIQY